MENLAAEGRTVLFVSHNIGAVEHLCQKVVVMRGGMIAFEGNTKPGIDYYLHSDAVDDSRQNGGIVDLTKHPGRPRRFRPLLDRLELFTAGNERVNGTLRMGATLKAFIYFRLEKPTANLNAGLGFDNLLGQRIFTAHSIFQPNREQAEHLGNQTFVCEIPSLTLVPGDYKVKLLLDLGNGEVDSVEDAVRLTVIPSDYYGTGKVPSSGFFVLQHRWELVDGAVKSRAGIEEFPGAVPSIKCD
jgi:lipopolysaccharide transport system ATP-binding protein